MDASIVKDFQKLHVLASYDLKRMDELVQDLTNALEETSRSPRSKSGPEQLSSGTLKRICCKKRRGRKRRPNSNCRYDGGNFSEASESSVEEALQGQELKGNATTTTTTHQSDSDDMVSSGRLRGPFPKLSCVITLAESDSVTENFSPLRPHRRRRKFKRMSIDPQPTEVTPCDVNMTGLCVKKPPQCKPKLKTLEAQNDNVMEEQLMEDGDDPSGGKRKRTGSSKDGDRPGGASGSLQSSSKMECMTQSQESSSSFSSGESDCGIFTNDEARDGDDEQSDFFHESGPSCGVPGIIPWWENGDALSTEEAAQEATFNSILTGSLDIMSTGSLDIMTTATKASYKSRMNRMGREIRTGRRRIKSGRMGYPPMGKQKAELTGLSMDKLTLWHGSNGASSSGDIKRRRQTPLENEQRSSYVGENALPIPESNIGNKMLQSMGWTPGSGLGARGAGITQPIIALRRAKRKGLGACEES